MQHDFQTMRLDTEQLTCDMLCSDCDQVENHNDWIIVTLAGHVTLPACSFEYPRLRRKSDELSVFLLSCFSPLIVVIVSCLPASLRYREIAIPSRIERQDYPTMGQMAEQAV